MSTSATPPKPGPTPPKPGATPPKPGATPTPSTSTSATPPAPTPDASSPPPDSSDSHKKLRRNLLIAGAAVLALAIPIVAACGKGSDDEKQDEDVKVTANAVVDKLVAWVKDVKQRTFDDDDDDGECHGENPHGEHPAVYTEVGSVVDFARTQSL